MSGDLSKLNILVGEAIKGLVDSGASAESIGVFAADFRNKAAIVLGLEASHPEAPDIQEVVKDAVSQVLEEAGLLKRLAKSPEPVKRFMVLVAGKRTSVSLSSAAAEKLITAKGSRKAANQLLTQLANSTPADVANRSKWIEERVWTALQFEGEATLAPALSRH